MRIDIWSDVVCPWCAIGKARLESALADFAHRDDVEVVYHSFQLDPSSPTEPTETAREMLSRKYRMSPAQAAEAQGRVVALAAEEGLDFTRHAESPVANTLDAHRLLHLALAEGGPLQQATLKQALFQAYFGDARNVADHGVLREVAVAAGLDPLRVDAVLAGGEYADDVEADIQQAVSYGASGVPFFVVDGRFGISGAQPTELFAQTLERAWRESHPVLETVPGAAADGECGPDGCPI